MSFEPDRAVLKAEGGASFIAVHLQQRLEHLKAGMSMLVLICIASGVAILVAWSGRDFDPAGPALLLVSCTLLINTRVTRYQTTLEIWQVSKKVAELERSS